MALGLLVLAACARVEPTRPDTAAMAMPSCYALTFGPWDRPNDPNVRDSLWFPLPARMQLVRQPSGAEGWQAGQWWPRPPDLDTAYVDWQRPAADSLTVRLGYAWSYGILLSLRQEGAGYRGVGVGYTDFLYEPRPKTAVVARPTSCDRSA